MKTPRLRAVNPFTASDPDPGSKSSGRRPWNAQLQPVTWELSHLEGQINIQIKGVKLVPFCRGILSHRLSKEQLPVLPSSASTCRESSTSFPLSPLLQDNWNKGSGGKKNWWLYIILILDFNQKPNISKEKYQNFTSIRRKDPINQAVNLQLFCFLTCLV